MRSTLVLVWLWSSGCDAGLSADEDPLLALPEPLALSGSAMAAAAPAAPGPLLIATRGALGELDGALRGVFGGIAEVTRQPPALHEPGRAVWGPLTPPLSPANYRVVVEGFAPDRRTFRLDGRPRAADDGAYRALVWGSADRFEADLDRLRELDAVAHPGGGRLRVVHRGGRVHAEHDDGATTRALELATSDLGAGSLTLAGPDGVLAAAWGADGAGHAELRGADGRFLLECWDRGFVTVACPTR